MPLTLEAIDRELDKRDAQGDALQYAEHARRVVELSNRRATRRAERARTALLAGETTEAELGSTPKERRARNVLVIAGIAMILSTLAQQD